MWKQIMDYVWNFLSAVGVLTVFFALIWVAEQSSQKPLQEDRGGPDPLPAHYPKPKPSKLPKAPKIEPMGTLEMPKPTPLPTLQKAKP